MTGGNFMATYEYLCSDCGPFDVRLAIGSAPATHDCPGCAGEARRVFSSPSLAVTPHGLTSSREREEKSREAPDVVSAPPPRERPAPRPHPALSRLPRP
ncbi:MULTISPECIES: zinc ribbon domain-containing protein [unclassified Streptomyces]|uniref:FmdB family zinc ribbon protein n=1 Tax=unclassified Streptomyces TaxID=2593676 RepID=UPI0018F89385|nr:MULTISPECIES: zinc ribbon domain-containing protein [unclassified Streptomyces]